MFKSRKVRNEDIYYVKCMCGFKSCILKNEATFLHERKQAEKLRDILNNLNKNEEDYIYDLNGNIIL